ATTARSPAASTCPPPGFPPRGTDSIRYPGHLLPLGFLVGGVPVRGPRRRVFTELLADHLLGHRDRDVLVAVIDAESQADELRQDGRAARPDLDNVRTAGFACLFRLAQDIGIDEGAFPDRTSHGSTTLLLGVARPQDVLVGRLVGAGLLALGRLAPRGNRVTAAGGAALAAAMRVVDRVHGDAAHGRADAQVTHAAGLAEVLVGMVGIRHRADGRHAFLAHQAQLAR